MGEEGGGGGGWRSVLPYVTLLNGKVWLDRVWFSRCSLLNRVSSSSLYVLNRVSLLDLMAKKQDTSVFLFHSSVKQGMILG